MALFKKKGETETKKPAAQKKRSFSFIRYCKEVIAELKKVTWPNRKEMVSYSVVVAVFIVATALVLLVMDTAFGALLDLILSI